MIAPTAALPAWTDWPAHSRAATVRSAEELRTAFRAPHPRGRAIDLTQLDRALRFDQQSGRVEIQPGASWECLAAFLQHHGMEQAWAFEAAGLASLPSTVGECMAGNCAMPDGSPFVRYVDALTVVTADAELRRVSRTRQPELFAAVNGGHGLIAAVYSVTLQIESLAGAFRHAEPAVTLGASAGHSRSNGPVMRLMVPPARLAGFLGELRLAFEDYRLPLDGLRVRKALPETESTLRWATEELALVEVPFPEGGTLPARVALTQIRRRLIAASLEHGGRFDLDTGFEASREQVEAAYPMFSAFLAEHRRCDPQERLGGAWYRHYRALFGRENCDVRWTQA